MSSIEFAVPPDADGQRLDRFLVSVLPEYSRSRIHKLIEEGHVRLGTREPKANAKVHTGEAIVVSPPAPVETALAPQELDLTIVYEDPDLVVVNKPAGMVVHPGAGHKAGTLVNALLHHVKDLSGVGGELRPGIVHRLDRGTSGLMVVAKNDETHHELARQFEDREVEKEYVALVWGVVHAGRRIDAAIGRDPGDRQKMSTRARRARSAVTRITKAEHLKGVTLAHVAIHTGRTHQIRVHLSAIGHPIVGDATYGGLHRRVAHDLKAVTRLTRPFLHAARLAFTHPRDGRRMEFTTAIPEDLQSVLDDIVAAQQP